MINTHCTDLYSYYVSIVTTCRMSLSTAYDVTQGGIPNTFGWWVGETSSCSMGHALFNRRNRSLLVRKIGISGPFRSAKSRMCMGSRSHVVDN